LFALMPVAWMVIICSDRKWLNKPRTKAIHKYQDIEQRNNNNNNNKLYKQWFQADTLPASTEWTERNVSSTAV
jgi:hypothetical protein